MIPFAVAFHDALPHGVLVGVALPSEPVEPPRAVLDALHTSEREAAAALSGYRLLSYVGGRIAAREALTVFQRRNQAVLSDARGAPIPPPGMMVSVSHKRAMAVALVARAELGHVGVDLEELGPPRLAIQDRVLTEDERAQVQELPAERQWTSVLLRFTIKEAIYKALAPTLQRYIGFEEAEVDPSVDGTAAVRLRLQGDAPPPSIEARYSWFDDHVLATVRARFEAPASMGLASDAPRFYTPDLEGQGES